MRYKVNHLHFRLERWHNQHRAEVFWKGEACIDTVFQKCDRKHQKYKEYVALGPKLSVVNEVHLSVI